MTHYSRACKQKTIHIVVDGHTESNVCRSVSTLVNMLVQCMLWLDDDRIVEIKKYSIAGGHSEITFVVLCDYGTFEYERFITTIDVIETGFRMLENTYPKCVKTDIEKILGSGEN